MTQLSTQLPSDTIRRHATAAPATCGEVTPDQARKWLDAGEAVLIDVREPDEHARERISGSHLLPLSRFDVATAAALAPPGMKLVMHCRRGRRSADACRMAASLASTGVPIFSMAGGLEAWKRERLPVQVNTRVSRISVMRQVQLVIGSLVFIGSALAWFVDPLFIGVPAFFGAGLIFAGASGTCALASLIAMLPWNRSAPAAGSCSNSKCS